MTGFDHCAVVFAVDETDLAVEAALAIQFFCHRIDIGPIELRDLSRRVTPEYRHAENARTSGNVENLQGVTLVADFEQIAERLGGRLGDDNDTENQLLPNLQLRVGVQAAQRLAGFERFLEIGHPVPER